MPSLENVRTFIYYIWLMTHLAFEKEMKLFCGYCLFPLFINRLAVVFFFKATPDELSQRAE